MPFKVESVAMFNRLENRMVLVVMLVNLLLTGLVITFLISSRAQHLDQLNVTAQNLAQLIELRILDKVRIIDDAIVRVKEELERELAAGGIEHIRLEQFLKSAMLRERYFGVKGLLLE